MKPAGLAVLVLALAVSVACSRWQPLVVEDRQQPSEARPARAQPAPAIYEVRRGDTLYSIAFRYGLDWRGVARWNRIEAPYTIRPGQELRLSAPPPERAAANFKPPVPSSSMPETAVGEPAGPVRARESESVVDEALAPAPAPVADSAGTRQAGGIDWRWPTAGRLVRPFDAAATRRGIGIEGQLGQAVLAAADGEVVYSGTALIGYGELIIIKHSHSLLSAYGHNRRRLVDEGSRVRGGQPIAEMGQNERGETVLHFEIRRDGMPVDPKTYLPPKS